MLCGEASGTCIASVTRSGMPCCTGYPVSCSATLRGAPWQHLQASTALNLSSRPHLVAQQREEQKALIAAAYLNCRPDLEFGSSIVWVNRMASMHSEIRNAILGVKPLRIVPARSPPTTNR